MTRRKCPSCDSFTDSLPEPEDRVIIDGVVECLIFADAEDMECHDRMERCSMCRPKLSPRALLRKHVRRPLRSNSAHSDDEDKKTVEHDDRKPAEEIPVSNVSSTTIPQAKRGRPRGSGKSLGNTKPKINNNNDNSENNFGSKTRRPHSKSLEPSSEVRVSPAKRRGRPPGSKNKVKPPPPPPPVKAATSATSNLVEADMPPIFVYGPVKDRRKQHTGASPIIELSPSRTEFAVSALNPQLMSSYSSSSPSSSLTPRVLSHGKMTRAGRRKFDEKTFAHLHCPKQYDPSFYHRHLDEEQQRQQTQHDEAAGSVSSSSSLPPAACGNSFCQLGCVCEDWGRDVDEIYEQLCGRFECVHGCVCPSASTSTTGGAGMVARPRRRRRWTDKSVGRPPKNGRNHKKREAAGD
ncbi:unnamed protein product [Notodromas monacha]|uniref:MGA conserved domain-containing protein n=1 Tax=Notodromas monacha TaxID=399045 RepID=A0A7R9BTA4_9CRUS|nr:unnamed protein product [Notodromas monacha]CAG0920284.1 unnamed protein product [Notodromas monacha]